MSTATASAPTPTVFPTSTATPSAAEASTVAPSAPTPAVPAGGEPVGSRSTPGGWFPTGAVPQADAAAGEARSPFPSTGVPVVEPIAGEPAAADDEDAEPARRRHPYTWLHLIVLAVVAFVLGFLIVALWNRGQDAQGAGAGAAGVVLETGPPGSSYAA